MAHNSKNKGDEDLGIVSKIRGSFCIRKVLAGNIFPYVARSRLKSLCVMRTWGRYSLMKHHGKEKLLHETEVPMGAKIWHTCLTFFVAIPYNMACNITCTRMGPLPREGLGRTLNLFNNLVATSYGIKA